MFRLTLQPKQRLIYDILKETGPGSPTRLGLGGSRGSMKSRTARDVAIDCALSNPGVLIYIVAKNLGNLEDNYVKKYRIERPDLMEFYRQSPRPEFTFPNEFGGSTIALRYADNPDDMTRLERGPEAFLVVVEQAEQFREQELIQLTKPNRWPSAPAGSAKTLYLFNPGGPGTEYLRRVFYLRQYTTEERPSDFGFVQSFGWDNWYWFSNECPDLDQESFYDLPGDIPPLGEHEDYDPAWLSEVPDNHRFKIFVTRTSEGRKYWALPPSIRMGDLFGRFDQFAGQYFAGVWDERLCVLPDDLVSEVIQPWWVAWLGMDWGFGHATAIYWAVIGKLSPSEARYYLKIETHWPLDIVIVYRELVVDHMAEVDVAKKIVEMTPEPERKVLRKFIAGSDVNRVVRWAPHTVNDLFESVTTPAGFPRISPAQDKPGSRVINARLLYEGLRRTTTMRSPAHADEQPTEKTVPCLFISAECPELIKAIPGAMTDPDRPDDFLKMETVADDCVDSAKYLMAEYLHVRTIAPRENRRQEEYAKAQDPTSRHIRMMEFDAKENASGRRIRTRR